MADRCRAHFRRDGLRVWCMLDDGHDGSHRVWQGDLDGISAAFAIQWTDGRDVRKVMADG